MLGSNEPVGESSASTAHDKRIARCGEHIANVDPRSLCLRARREPVTRRGILGTHTARFEADGAVTREFAA